MTKVDLDLRNKLIAIHVNEGWKAGSEASRKHGLGKNYAYQSWQASVAEKRPRQPQDHDDPRWAWAIERGAVII